MQAEIANRGCYNWMKESYFSNSDIQRARNLLDDGFQVRWEEEGPQNKRPRSQMQLIIMKIYMQMGYITEHQRKVEQTISLALPPALPVVLEKDLDSIIRDERFVLLTLSFFHN